MDIIFRLADPNSAEKLSMALARKMIGNTTSINLSEREYTVRVNLGVVESSETDIVLYKVLDRYEKCLLGIEIDGLQKKGELPP